MMFSPTTFASSCALCALSSASIRTSRAAVCASSWLGERSPLAAARTVWRAAAATDCRAAAPKDVHCEGIKTSLMLWGCLSGRRSEAGVRAAGQVWAGAAAIALAVSGNQ